MDYQSKIRKLFALLFPTGRAWQYLKGSEDREGIEDIFTDGFSNNFTDGYGIPFYSFLPQFTSTTSKRLTDAKLKSFDTAYEDTIGIQDSILPDNDNFDSVDADRWERVLQIPSNTTDLEIRKQRIARQLYYPSGVVERSNYEFIQEQIRAAGFDVYIVENRFWNGSEFEIIDPDTLATQDMESGLPESGVYESAGEIPGIDYTNIIANFIDESLDNGFFTAPVISPVESGVFESGTIESGGGGGISLDRDIQLQASFFIGGSSFPSIVDVDITRKDEFRQLILKLKPNHTLGFEYINYT